MIIDDAMPLLACFMLPYCVHYVNIEKRKAEAGRIRAKYPDRIPVRYHTFVFALLCRFHHLVASLANGSLLCYVMYGGYCR
jgi:hypothetical protein